MEIIELQVDERRRQLEEENKSLNEKLQELMKGLSEVIKESVENHAGFEKSCVKVTVRLKIVLSDGRPFFHKSS